MKFLPDKQNPMRANIHNGFLIGKPTLDSGLIDLLDGWIEFNNTAADREYIKVDPVTRNPMSGILREKRDKLRALDDGTFHVQRNRAKFAKGPKNPDGTQPTKDVWEATIPSGMLGKSKGLGISSETFGLFYEATQANEFRLGFSPEALLNAEMGQHDICVNLVMTRSKAREMILDKWNRVLPELKAGKKAFMWNAADNCGISFHYDNRNAKAKYQAGRIYNKTLKEFVDLKRPDLPIPGNEESLDVIRFEINFAREDHYQRHGMEWPRTVEDLFKELDRRTLIENAVFNTLDGYLLEPVQEQEKTAEPETENELQLRIQFELVHKLGGTINDIRRLIYDHKSQTKDPANASRYKKRCLTIWQEIEERAIKISAYNERRKLK